MDRVEAASYGLCLKLGNRVTIVEFLVRHDCVIGSELAQPRLATPYIDKFNLW